MIKFKKVRWKNFLSTGNAFSEIDLDIGKPILISGNNGGGKCVFSNTRITVEQEIPNKPGHYHVLYTTVGEVYDLFQLNPNRTDLFVNTRNGYKRIITADITAKDSVTIKLKVSKGNILKCSPNHLVWCNNEWTKAKDLKLNDNISIQSYNDNLTSTENVPIIQLKLLKKKYDLYDLQVDGEEYFTNGIVSHNSTILDAITFPLFGKPFRNISKGGLVNSINDKNCITEIEFEESGIQYKVIRGIKPNIFEIYRNNELINQEAATKDYQVILEQQILKMNYKTFTQVVILGSATYTPFMQLSTSQRREIIEDLLDIRIFSTMNSLLKDQLTKTKEELSNIDSSLKLARGKVESQQKIIGHLQSNKQTEIDVIQNQIIEDKQFIDSKIKTKEGFDKDISIKKNALSNKQTIEQRITALNNSMRKIKHEIDTVQKSIVFFNESANCPSCKQGIAHEHSTSIIEDLNISKSNMNTLFIDDMTEYKKLNDELAIIKKVEEECRKLEIEVGKIQTEINVIETKIKQSKHTLKEAVESIGDIDKEKSILKELVDDAISCINRQKLLIEQKSIEDSTFMLLKDTGIKSAIIKEYLPLINNLINKNLAVTDFFINFQLNENFEESILSRGRDKFNFASFSEGEKARISISILFAWREVARLKNSANCNLLILDEIFTGAADQQAVEGIMSIIDSLENTSVFVISHNQDTKDMFTDVINIEKQGNFSVIK
jgi:DNA repair exonuclease SbcCD ATPase subunit